MKAVSRLIVNDKDRIMRGKLEDLATLRIFGSTKSHVVRVLVSLAHHKHFLQGVGYPPDYKELYERERNRSNALRGTAESLINLVEATNERMES